ncbi:MAG: MarR family transcriptional regulator [Bacilli bacterium]|nr:MarR family transcriptional regulator [Bacilli bacterium]
MVANKEKTRTPTKPDKLIQIAKTLSKKMSPEEEKLVKYLIENKGRGVSYSEIEKALSMPKPSISRRVSKLQNEGLVVKGKSKNQTEVKWLGGVEAIENELNQATSSFVNASILAENYDLLVIDPFSVFSLIFENNYWEIIANLQEGLNDVELSQRIGNAISLDSIRRILVICDAHNIIKMSNVREHAGDDIVKLFEPLYKIEIVNKEFKACLILIRGLASAISYRMEGKNSQNYSHIYDPILESIFPMFLSLKDKVNSNTNIDERDVLKKVIDNYDFAPDMDRIYRHENWKKKLKSSENITIDEKTDHILISKTLCAKYKDAIKKSG